MALVELLGQQVQGKEGTVEVSSIAEEAQVVGIYFSAHWCPPCRNFTPVLGEYYTKLRAQNKAFQIVFVSSDRTAEACDEYYKSMPWLVLPWDDRDRKESLGDKYGVRGIPTLVLVDAKTGELITAEGRRIVGEDPEGAKFPWK